MGCTFVDRVDCPVCDHHTLIVETRYFENRMECCLCGFFYEEADSYRFESGRLILAEVSHKCVQFQRAADHIDGFQGCGDQFSRQGFFKKDRSNVGKYHAINTWFSGITPNLNRHNVVWFNDGISKEVIEEKSRMVETLRLIGNADQDDELGELKQNKQVTGQGPVRESTSLYEPREAKLCPENSPVIVIRGKHCAHIVAAAHGSGVRFSSLVRHEEKEEENHE